MLKLLYGSISVVTAVCARSPLFPPTADMLHASHERQVLMRWTAPTTGIAMRQDTVDVAERFESAYG